MKQSESGTRSGWVSIGVAIIVSVVITAALVAAQTRGLQPSGASSAPLATLSATRNPTPITLGDYLITRRGLTDSSFVPSRVTGQSGQIVTFHVTNLALAANERCEVRWTQLDRDRLRPAEAGPWRYELVLGWPNGLLSPTQVKEGELTGELWVPLPNPYVDVGWFLVRLQLSCTGQQAMAVDTDEFRVEPPPFRPNAGVPLS